jgi:hypothetical protein
LDNRALFFKHLVTWIRSKTWTNYMFSLRLDSLTFFMIATWMMNNSMHLLDRLASAVETSAC